MCNEHQTSSAFLCSSEQIYTCDKETHLNCKYTISTNHATTTHSVEFNPPNLVLETQATFYTLLLHNYIWNVTLTLQRHAR
jgi:hypothetical protein